MANGQVVVVTGAAAGIGRAIARRFGEDGARVALISRNRAGLEAAARDVESGGGESLVIPADVADHAAMEAAADAVEESLGEIDVWVNNAMATIFAFFEDIEPDEFIRSTQVTYLGTVWGTRSALRRMVPRDRGSVVQVGSAMAYRGIPLQAPYCGAKHAIKGFVESIRTELRHKGSNVHVGMVQLPGLNTPQFDHGRSKMPKKPMPVPPIYQPEVAAEAVHHCAKARRREIYVGGPAVYTIWGNKLSPLAAEIYLAKTGVSGQQTDQPIDPPRLGNLFEPPDHDEGAHGDFDDQAHPRSLQLWLTKHRRALGGAAALAAAAVAAGAVAGPDRLRR
jgi:NAD(P)-dependent dehydrogenase (short-subunit alcohol dehydrogenase family)